MEIESNEYENLEQQMAGETGSDSATAKSTLERGAEGYAQAKKVLGDVSDKTARVAGETYEKAKSYSSENPGKTILIAVGLGVGLGFVLGANSHHSRTGRFARPVVNALSDIALTLFR